MKQGEVVFPRQPLLIVEGPLAITQLLETTLLNLVNYPSLVATNAMRMRIAASISSCKRMLPSHNQPIELLEFGLRRAQGPDGGISASKYAYIGGFSGSSNVLAGKLTGIPIKGTHAHAFVMSYRILEDLKSHYLLHSDGQTQVNFYDLVLEKRKLLGFENSNFGELLAFISYAQSHPNGFIALVDTYDTVSSGVLNFIVVGLALHELGYKPVGVRLDSGDLSYLSKVSRKLFIDTDVKLRSINYIDSSSTLFSYCKIVASNDIDEKIILSLCSEGHEIDTLAVGTNLVTCSTQPALGCVFKLVEINKEPRIKLSQDSEKVVIPSKKSVYRLIGKDNHPIVDIMLKEEEQEPQVNQRILCRHAFIENKRAFVTPSKVIPLLHLVWDGSNGGEMVSMPSLDESRDYCWQTVLNMREDHIRPMNPTPYKVSVSDNLFNFFHQLIQKESPIADLS